MSDRAAPGTYRVLARTYRPGRLSELIGQEALVRTVTNAFRTGRIAHAFLLSGIRGVGKTTTARILAKGLNCTGPDGSGGPTPEPCGVCPSCVAIAEDRALDVIEMDAASQTGKADVLDLVQGIQLVPAAARFKVYILDEVHMLSEKAWNALLKTVEEPPPHAKFVFATTEPRKVPVTVLSRCQRFELRRVEPAVLEAHLARVCEREGVAAEPAALALIAGVAEGSVRDALSLLDQAIAVGAGRVEAASVQDMLGLADRSRLVDLLEAALIRDPAATLERLDALHALGADPRLVLQDLLELVHRASRLAVGVAPGGAAAADGPGERLAELARGQGPARLARAWQVLLKGLEEVRGAPSAAAAAEMVLLRLACLAEVPPPGELARLLRELAVPAGTAPVASAGRAPVAVRSPMGGVSAAPGAVAQAQPQPAAAPSPRPAAPAVAPEGPPPSFAGLVALLRRNGEGSLAAWLAEAAHLVRLEPGRLELRAQAGVPRDLPGRVAEALGRLTGRRWLVALSEAPGEPTLAEQAERARAARLDELGRSEPIRGLLELFPGARIVDIRPAEPVGSEERASEEGRR